MRERISGNRSIPAVWKVLFFVCITIVVVALMSKFRFEKENPKIDETLIKDDENWVKENSKIDDTLIKENWVKENSKIDDVLIKENWVKENSKMVEENEVKEIKPKIDDTLIKVDENKENSKIDETKIEIELNTGGDYLNIEIPRREKNDQNESRLILEKMSHLSIEISQFPAIIKFFTYFTFDSENISSNIPPWEDLAVFLKKLRITRRNMFVAPIGKVNFHEEKRAVVKVNIVWESAGPCQNDPAICVYGAFGDIGYVDFVLDTEKNILDWKFKHIMDPPYYHPYKQTEPRKSDTKDFKVNGLPTLYLNCSYAGRYVYLYQGWFDIAWLKYWKFIEVAEDTQNGVQSFSSIDATGCWSVSLWLENEWKGGNMITNNLQESCFREAMGYMNDRAMSISCFYLCNDKVLH